MDMESKMLLYHTFKGTLFLYLYYLENYSMVESGTQFMKHPVCHIIYRNQAFHSQDFSSNGGCFSCTSVNNDAIDITLIAL